MRRMAQEPRNRNGSICHTLVGCYRIDLLIERGELGIIKENTFKETILEGRPRLNDNILQAAVIQDAPIPVDGTINFHIDVDPRIDHSRISDAELKLIEVDLLLDEFGQQFDLHRILVADAKIFHLAAGF